ncbi:unnamed protein product [Linum tenue]|uniref:DUF3615 domain-containing protein n=1 Tax=Linum tenue TaxID=586396 RepID=A0AAV0H1Z1_9ROSI|nr:unnamed protein product [Linum tenue]
MVWGKDKISERQEMGEPPSPKKQKMEDRPDHHDEQLEVGAADPLPSSSFSSSVSQAPVVSPERNLLDSGAPDQEVPVGDESFEEPSSPMSWFGLDPECPWHEEVMKSMNTGFGSSSEDEDGDLKTEEEERMKRDTLGLADIAIEYYNKTERVSYVFDKPFLCRCILFELVMVFHFNFTAKEENPSPKEGNNPSSPLFFAEAIRFYGGDFNILKCVKLDTFGGDNAVRNGCIYCRKEIKHPPVGICEFGVNEIDDYKNLERQMKANTSP